MGYFALGWPRKYHGGGPGGVEKAESLVRDRCGRLLCVVTKTTLSVWSAGRHRIALGSVSLTEDFALIGACFDAAGRRIVAVDASGRLLFLRLSTKEHTSSILHFDAVGAETGATHVDVDLSKVDITTSAVLELDGRPNAVTPAENSAFIGCESGDLYSISLVEEDLQYRFNLPKVLLASGVLKQLGAYQCQGDPQAAVRDNSAIAALDFCQPRSLLAVVLKSGAALLMTASEGRQPDPEKGWWLRTDKSVSVAVEPTRGAAAVGLDTGDVELYIVGYTPGEKCQLLRRFSLLSWYFVPQEIGAARQLRWSDDGTALAVGWDKQGLVVWSVTGCRLIWTLPQVGSAVASTPVSSARGGRYGDSLSRGVRAIEWGPQGFSVLAVPKKHEIQMFVEYQLFKSAILDSPFQSEATRLAMMGSDSILMLGHREENEEELFDWQQLYYHTDYLAANWPIANVAVSADLHYLAVAGRRGFAVCSVRTRRWRLFGDISQERAIKICALAWLGKYVCACYERRDGTYEMKLYPREHLDESAVMATVPLAGKVECIDVRDDGCLLLLCQGGQLTILKHVTAPRVGLKVVLEVALQKDLASEIATARIFPPLAMLPEGTNAQTPTQVLLLKLTGSLLLLDLVNLLSVPLLRNVEHLWYTSSAEVPFDWRRCRPLFWAHGEEGLFVSLGHEIDRSRKSEPAERWFDWDPEVYPLGLTAVHGMVLGVTQGLIFNNVPKENPLSSPYHVIKVKRQPVLHRILRHVLMRSTDDRKALQLALRCVKLPQFEDALEWLLYETVLEHDRNDCSSSSNEAEMRRGLFGRVIWLLNYFGEYEDIVVRCARKMDSHWWPLLFEYAGEPASLLEVCSHTNRLRTAACLLVILQEMFGYASSTPHALRLLNASLATGQLELAVDLGNFLRKAQEANMLNLVQVQLPLELSDLFEEIISLDSYKGPNRPLPIVLASVLAAAQGMFEDSKLRSLNALARVMNFPLSTWLAKMRSMDKSVVFEPEKQLHILHEQFKWPVPDVELVTSRVEIFKGVRDGSSDLAKCLPGQLSSRSRRRYDENVRREVVYLQKTFLKASCVEHAVLLSVLLIDFEAILALLLAYRSLSDKLLAALRGHRFPGYRLLCTSLEEQLSEDRLQRDEGPEKATTAEKQV